MAGRLQEVRDQFTTASGRAVALRIHVEPGDEHLCAHAMASLKRSMAWDEQAFGLEYDLDEFNLVAVRHFNMGAMENKSLNIFNSKLVLADRETATDAELERIESVIGHEYFHNWTGNRVTCRDWFQLSLKEGLTVFRDQEFTSDLHGAALKRIEDVAMLRAAQFPEDAGPTAHPVQPSEYIAIDNFYTTTIYEKGAELIRMQRTLLGSEAFLKGVQLYLRRHDGQAATCEQFVQALEEASGVSLQTFRRWYHQAGTPQLSLQTDWDGAAGELKLTLSQLTPPRLGKARSSPCRFRCALVCWMPVASSCRSACWCSSKPSRAGPCRVCRQVPSRRCCRCCVSSRRPCNWSFNAVMRIWRCCCARSRPLQPLGCRPTALAAAVA